jgi:hypothetical protein
MDMDAKLFASKPELIEAALSSAVRVVVIGTKAREPIGSDPNKSISKLLTAEAAGAGADADGALTGAADQERSTCFVNSKHKISQQAIFNV